MCQAATHASELSSALTSPALNANENPVIIKANHIPLLEDAVRFSFVGIDYALQDAICLPAAGQKTGHADNPVSRTECDLRKCPYPQLCKTKCSFPKAKTGSLFQHRQ